MQHWKWPMLGAQDGRADGRGRRVPGHGRADGRAARTILNDSTTMFIDFHKKTSNGTLFFCRFASDGSASTDLEVKKKRLQQMSKKHYVFSVISHPAEAQVPIFTA